MRVALDARLVEGDATGDSTYWTGLLHGLKQIEGPEFLLLSDRPAPEGWREDARFRWVTVPARSGRWWSLVRFPLAARRYGAHVIHTQYSLSPLAGRRSVTTVHDVSFLIGPDWFRPRDRALLTLTVPAACRRAGAVVTVSETSRAEIERLIPAAQGKTWATPLACPPWIVARDRGEARRRVTERFGPEPYLLSVSTRWPRKNMELAVAAADRLPDPLPHRLWLTGKAGAGGGLGARGRALGYVDRDTLCDLYSAADLYLCPSRHEGFGLPVLEAFRCGAPVVATRGGALPEVAGGAALHPREDTPEGWGDAITGLLTNAGRREALAAEGQARERQFSWTQTAARTLAVYERVLGTP